MANEKNTTKNKLIEDKTDLKMTAIICSTLLGGLTILGIFWGKDGYMLLGLLILGALLISIIFFSD